MSHELASATYDWLTLPSHEPVPGVWVPGASDQELSALNALGGIARTLMPKRAHKRLPEAVAQWVAASPMPPAEVVEDAARAFNADPDKSLATAYARLVRAANRRRLGTFFTPAPEVKMMLDMWDAHQPRPSTVIDVGAGVGVFTAAAAKQWPSARVLAVDINPVTLGLLGVRLYRHDITTFGKVALVHGDFTEELFDNPAFRQPHRLILGNPPYTRAQLLPVSERRRLEALSGGLCNSRASLSTSITAMSLLNLEATDGLCLLLPAQWLEADYARELRATLWRSERRRIELRLVESSLFDGALVDAVALMVSPETDSPGLFVSRWSQEATLPLTRARNACPSNWRTLFDDQTLQPIVDHSSGLDESAPPSAVPAPITLGSVAKVRRGLATGANTFFILTTAGRSTSGLGRYLSRRIVVRMRDMPNVLATSEAKDDGSYRFVLQASREQVLNDIPLAEYIQHGQTEGFDKRYLCAQRRDWFDLTREIALPDVIFGPMTRGEFRVVVNDSEVAISNNLYGLTWLPDTSAEARLAIVEWLRGDDGQAALRGIARQQGSGLLKIEPKALQRLELPKQVRSLVAASA